MCVMWHEEWGGGGRVTAKAEGVGNGQSHGKEHCSQYPIQYVCQTKNELLIRFQSHYVVIKHNNNTTVARHFNRCPKPIPGKFEGMDISILSFFHPPPSSRASQELRDRLEKLIHRLSGVVPRGLTLLE